MAENNGQLNCNGAGVRQERRLSRSSEYKNSKAGPRRGSKTELNARGRKVEANPPPTSWIRSASTSSLLRLKRNDRAQSKSKKDEEMNRSESLCRVETALAEERKQAERSVLVDVLPSFELYNSLHRHIPQGNIDPDRHDFPPCYQEVQTQCCPLLRANDQPESIALDVADPGGIRSNSSVSLTNLRPLSTRHLNLHEPPNALNEELNMIEDDLNDSDNINIDKLYSLPKLITPVELDIRIAKHTIKPHEKPEEESLLKEYTSGEIIHGYCVIENKSTQPLKFEMFYVTLEGYISVTDRQKGKRTLKRFLRMVDLSASWSYSHIDVSSGVKVVPGDIDFDDAILGLNNNRMLEPGRKYKKFFMFKLPNQLLDCTCKHEQFSHCLLPPSFGIDRFRNGGKYAGIKINNILGCGHLGIKGSPILTLDMAEESLSVNYTIDAKLVGKAKKTQKLNIMKEHQYHLRLIPFGFTSPVIGERVSSQQFQDLSDLVEERLEALKRVFEKLKNSQPISPSDVHGTDICGTVDGIQLNMEEITARKMDQLHLNNRVSTQHDLFRKPDLKGRDCTAEAELSYKLKPKSSSSLKGGIFTGFKSTQSHSGDSTKDKLNKVGLIVLKASIPVLSLPYWSPSLLRKKNKFDEKNEHDQENWLRMSSFVPEELKKKLEHIDIQLECTQSNNSAPHEPPEIQSVTTELVCITAKSDNSIPIKLDAKMLMNQEKLQIVKRQYVGYLSEIENYSELFQKNLTELNELYSLSSVSTAPRQLSFTDFISSQMHNDVESLANLSTKVTCLPEIFKKQVHTAKKSSPDSLSSGSSGTSLSKNGSGTFLVGSSGSSLDVPRTSTKIGENVAIREWVPESSSQYKRTIRVNLEYSQNIKETLVPSFESCLCCRFYCVRVHIKFDNHVGTATIDIPVSVKNLHC